MELVGTYHEQHMPTLKKKFMKRFSSLQNIEFHHTKHEVEKFAYDLKCLGRKIGMLGKQVLEHFKEPSHQG